MIKNGLLLHDSGDHRIPFIDGYYFYYAPECKYISNTLHISYIIEVHVYCMFILNSLMFVMIYSFFLFIKYLTSVYDIFNLLINSIAKVHVLTVYQMSFIFSIRSVLTSTSTRRGRLGFL